MGGPSYGLGMTTAGGQALIKALMAAIVAVLTGMFPSWSPTQPPPTPQAAPGAPPPALQALRALPVKGKASATGYSRDQFGTAWTDATDRPLSRNGCDTRSDTVARSSTNATFKPGTRGCVVLTSTIYDPYTGHTIAYRRGDGTVAVEHVVALKNAWLTGAQLLTLEERTALANDPANLVAVSSNVNSAKGASDAASWLPPNKAYRCDYAARQIAVKATYRLWVTPAEKTALERVLQPCPGSVLPDVQPLPPRAPSVKSSARPSSGRSSEPFLTCAQARAAGEAPLSSSHPRYSARLDRDGDGRACEATG